MSEPTFSNYELVYMPKETIEFAHGFKRSFQGFADALRSASQAAKDGKPSELQTLIGRHLRLLNINAAGTKFLRLHQALESLGVDTTSASFNVADLNLWQVEQLVRYPTEAHPDTIKELIDWVTDGSPAGKMIINTIIQVILSKPDEESRQPSKILIVEDVPFNAFCWEILAREFFVTAKVLGRHLSSNEREETIRLFQKDDRRLQVLILHDDVDASIVDLGDYCKNVFIHSPAFNMTPGAPTLEKMFRVPDNSEVIYHVVASEHINYLHRDRKKSSKLLLEVYSRMVESPYQQLAVDLLNKERELIVKCATTKQGEAIRNKHSTAVNPVPTGASKGPKTETNEKSEEVIIEKGEAVTAEEVKLLKQTTEGLSTPTALTEYAALALEMVSSLEARLKVDEDALASMDKDHEAWIKALSSH